MRSGVYARQISMSVNKSTLVANRWTRTSYFSTSHLDLEILIKSRRFIYRHRFIKHDTVRETNNWNNPRLKNSSSVKLPWFPVVIDKLKYNIANINMHATNKKKFFLIPVRARARAHTHTHTHIHIWNEIAHSFIYDIRIEAIVALTTSFSMMSPSQRQ